VCQFANLRICDFAELTCEPLIDSQNVSWSGKKSEVKKRTVSKKLKGVKTHRGEILRKVRQGGGEARDTGKGKGGR
jgi:hypothetical protein